MAHWKRELDKWLATIGSETVNSLNAIQQDVQRSGKSLGNNFKIEFLKSGSYRLMESYKRFEMDNSVTSVHKTKANLNSETMADADTDFEEGLFTPNIISSTPFSLKRKLQNGHARCDLDETLFQNAVSETTKALLPGELRFAKPIFVSKSTSEATKPSLDRQTIWHPKDDIIPHSSSLFDSIANPKVNSIFDSKPQTNHTSNTKDISDRKVKISDTKPIVNSNPIENPKPSLETKSMWPNLNSFLDLKSIPDSKVILNSGPIPDSKPILNSEPIPHTKPDKKPKLDSKPESSVVNRPDPKSAFANAPNIKEWFCYYCKEQRIRNHAEFAFPSIDEVYAHWQYKHSDVPFQFYWVDVFKCNFCRYISSFHRLRYHYDTDHPNENFVAICNERCAVCLYAGADLDTHVCHEHDKLRRLTIFNPILFTEDTLAELRTINMSTNKNFQCEYCGRVSGSRQTILDHHRKHHGNKQINLKSLNRTAQIVGVICGCCRREMPPNAHDDHLKSRAQSRWSKRAADESDFDRFDEQYLRTKVIFDNGLVVFKQNLLATEVGGYWAFRKFCDEHVLKTRYSDMEMENLLFDEIF